MTKVLKNRFWGAVATLIFINSIYWLFIATNQYVSKTNIVLESPQISAPSLSLNTLFSGSSTNSGMLLLRDYLLSFDLLSLLDNDLNIREHYSSDKIDFVSRLGKDVPIEQFHSYMQNKIKVELDEYSGILRIEVSAYSPEMSNKIANYLINKGEEKMNELGQKLAFEQVQFLEKQVSDLFEDFEEKKKGLLHYQNTYGTISPTETIKSISGVISELESQLTQAQVKRGELLKYSSAQSPSVKNLEYQINALKNQINKEKLRVADDKNSALNLESAKFEEIQMGVEFAQQSYAGALEALQTTRIESARKLKQVSILQTPTLPQYSEKPDRIYNVVSFIIFAVFLSLIIQMVVFIIKDHRD
jgi:capsular polysaccharide transport system permease protein